MTKRILIVSGEPSGDLHASNLVKDLKRLDPGLQFFGLGGRLSRQAGVDVVCDISELAVVGAVEALKKIFAIGKAYRRIISRTDSERPDLAILVDYPGFNLRLAGALKSRGIPIAYYISPQVWAWGKNRIDIIKKCVSRIIVFFKFEEELYKSRGIDAEFVGHPLLDVVKTTMPKDEVLKIYDLIKGKPVISILPGSRAFEVKTLLPIMVSAAKIISRKPGGAQFIIAKHPDLPVTLYEEAVKGLRLDIRLADGDTYNVLGASDFAVVASGTATLETAVIGTPLVIVYKAGLITYLLYRIVSRTPFLGLVNILAGKEVAPELLQCDATPERIADKVAEMLSDKEKLAAIREDLKKVKSSLGLPGAGPRAAGAILPLLQ